MTIKGYSMLFYSILVLILSCYTFIMLSGSFFSPKGVHKAPICSPWQKNIIVFHPKRLCQKCRPQCVMQLSVSPLQPIKPVSQPTGRKKKKISVVALKHILLHIRQVEKNTHTNTLPLTHTRKNLRYFPKWCKRNPDILSSNLWIQITHKNMEVI